MDAKDADKRQLKDEIALMTYVDIAEKLIEKDYEAIALLDSATGAVIFRIGEHFKEIITFQDELKNNVRGVEAYLRKYCVDNDIERVIKETSLSYVKEQLAKKTEFSVAYALYQKGCTVHKRVVYLFLDEKKTTIICATQNISDLYNQASSRQDQIAQALQALQEEAGMDVGRYDLRTKIFYSNSSLLSKVGYGKVIENVPETFITNGHIHHGSIEKIRSFYDKLLLGENAYTTVACTIPEGGFHWIRMDARVLFDWERKPYFAIVSFRDIEKEREHSAVFQKWHQEIVGRPADSYTLFRCNLTQGSSFSKQEGKLLRIKFDPTKASFNERTQEYARRFVHLDDFDDFITFLNAEQLLASYYRDVTSFSFDYRERVRFEEYQWLHLSVELVPYQESMDIEAFLLFEQAKEESSKVLEIKERIEKDDMTGLLNMNGFTEHFDALLADSTPSSKHALLFLHVDGLARINESYGYSVGNMIIENDAVMLKKLLNKDDILGRYGGDTFLIGICNYSERADLEEKTTQLLKLLHREFSPDLCLTSSCGIALYPEDGKDFRSLLRSSDKARCAAKSQAANNFSFARGLESLPVLSSSTDTVMIEYEWGLHKFIYNHFISKVLWGTYDQRPLWTIFMLDMVAEARDVRAMQELIMNLASSSTKMVASFDVRLKTAANRKHWFTMNAFRQVDAAKLTKKIVLTFRDINESVAANTKLRFQAEHDELTGLYNRKTFLKLVAETVRYQEPNSYCLFSCDINGFRFINEHYGRTEGDRILQYSADRINEYAVSAHGFAGRISADVYAVLVPNIQGVIERVENIAKHFFDDYPKNIRISGRCGAYVISTPEESSDTMLDCVMTAGNSIKHRYSFYLAVFDENMNKIHIREKFIAYRMEEALQSGEFTVYLQPQIHHTTHKIIGAEALTRWIDPERGVVSPAEFIPIFEKNGFITKLDYYIWEKTAQLIATWLTKGYEPIPVSVNVSREDIYDPKLCQTLLAIVGKYHVPTNLFRLEITESVFAEEMQQITAVVDELHKAGFLVEMDDFGSGYSSLNVLKEVHMDVIKLDMKFFSGKMDNGGRSGTIISAVLRMARGLNIPVIAEGVEKKEDADFLLSVGCPIIQGFLYEKPLPIAEFEKKILAGGIYAPWQTYYTENELNVEAFCNPMSVDSQIFNNFFGPAAIFEYAGGEYELLRANKRYYELLGFDKSSVVLPKQFVLPCGRDEIKFKEVVLKTIEFGKDSKDIFNFHTFLGTDGPLCVSLRLIYKNDEHAILFASLETIST